MNLKEQRKLLKEVDLEVQVLDVLKAHSKMGGVTWEELKDELNNVYFADLVKALKSLARLGMIKTNLKLNSFSNKFSVYKYVNDLSERNQLILQQKKIKYLKWLKKADDYMEFMGHKTVKMICYEQEEHGL